MVRRSVLFTPGDRPEMMRKAASSNADVVVFDLEDAVAPDRKESARRAVREVLVKPDFDPDPELCVRVNPVGSGAKIDLERVFADANAVTTVDGVLVPKVSSVTDVETIGAELDGLDGLDRTLPLLALIETAAGVLAASEIAAVEGVDVLLFGAEDLAADLGASRSREETEVLYARQRVVLACAAHDVDAIDAVYTDFEDTEGLRAAAEQAVRWGFDGKMAIHPAQIEPIHEAFTPSSDEVAWANDVLTAAREAEDEGRGVFEVDGEMIDAPLIARAERIVELVEAGNR